MSETIPTQTPVSVPTTAPRAGAPLLSPGSVNTEALVSEAVTSAKIANEAITEPLLAAAVKALLLGAEHVTEAMLVKAVQEKLNPGVWTALEGTSAKVGNATGFQTVMVRLEDGGTMARLRGAYLTSAEVPGSTALAKLPAAFRLGTKISFPPLPAGSGGQISITAAGELTVAEKVETAAHIYLDGYTWNLT